MTKQRYQKILHVLQHRQPDLSVLAENIHKPHNLSAMLRSCDAVGIGKVHAVNPTGGVPTYNDTSASANKWVMLEVHASLSHALGAARQQGMQLLAAHFSDQARDYREIDYCQPSCILMGNEKWGVSDEAAAAADAHILIPMLGMIQSLNVSVATAVILFEAQRQRREAGYYQQARLQPEVLAAQAFRWLYPREAAQLSAEGKPFPALDDEGNILANSLTRG